MYRPERRYYIGCGREEVEDDVYAAGGVEPGGLRRGVGRRWLCSGAPAPALCVPCEGATPQSSAMKAMTAALALPSTGGAVRRIFKRSPCRPASSFFAARGCTRTRKRRSSPSHWNHGAAIRLSRGDGRGRRAV